MTYTKVLMACGAALLTVSLGVTARAAADPTAPERFTFSVPGTDGRFEVVIDRWSTDVQRDRVVTVLKQDGPDALRSAFWSDSTATGYINWPGSLTYTLRYARRTPRGDGGEDIVLVADHRMWAWWPSAPSIGPTARPFTVIHLRLGSDGQGEARVSSNITADAQAGVAVENYANQPLVLTNVKRERRLADSATS